MLQKIASTLLLSVTAVLAAGYSAGDANSPAAESLRNVQLGPDDIAVRIHYLGNLAVYNSSLTLIRRNDRSTADYLVTYDIVGIAKPANLEPVVTWDSIWKQIASDRIFDLHGSANDPVCRERSFPVDSDSVEVEVRRGILYRKYLYYNPLSGQCAEVRHMASTLQYLQRAFSNQLPIPYPSLKPPP